MFVMLLDLCAKAFAKLERCSMFYCRPDQSERDILLPTHLARNVRAIYHH